MTSPPFAAFAGSLPTTLHQLHAGAEGRWRRIRRDKQKGPASPPGRCNRL